MPTLTTWAESRWSSEVQVEEGRSPGDRDRLDLLVLGRAWRGLAELMNWFGNVLAHVALELGYTELYMELHTFPCEHGKK